MSLVPRSPAGLFYIAISVPALLSPHCAVARAADTPPKHVGQATRMHHAGASYQHHTVHRRDREVTLASSIEVEISGKDEEGTGQNHREAAKSQGNGDRADDQDVLTVYSTVYLDGDMPVGSSRHPAALLEGSSEQHKHVVVSDDGQPGHKQEAIDVEYARDGFRGAELQRVLEGEQTRAAQVAMCVSVKDDAEALREWILYHLCLGVGKFHVYDDSSHPPLLSSIHDMVKRGLVTYHYVRLGQPAQLWAYNDCLTRHRHEHTWVMGLDVDEFVVLHPDTAGTRHLPTFLKSYESYGGVAVQWKVYGSSGHVSIPRGGILRNYSRCMRDNTRHRDGYGIKTIARTEVTKAWVTAHHVEYFSPDTWYTVDPDTMLRQSGNRMRLYDDGVGCSQQEAAGNMSVTQLPARKLLGVGVEAGQNGVGGGERRLRSEGWVSSGVRRLPVVDDANWVSGKVAGVQQRQATLPVVREGARRLPVVADTSGDGSRRVDCVRQGKIQLNHYATRSREDFARKVARGTGDGLTRGKNVYWARVERLATDECLEGVQAGVWCFGQLENVVET